jgi:hypothetical protein
MMMNTPPLSPLSLCNLVESMLNTISHILENMPQERLQAYKTIRMENLPGFFLVWRGSLTNITSAMSSNANNTASKKNLPIATFNAVFSMVMLNGSALHRHQISNFSLTDMSIPNNGIIVYNGTASITMKEGPVNDVPLSIKTLNDNVISIWVDPAKTMNHFGNTPIYGTIIRDVVIRK